ncbi:YopX family protein [Bacillus sp. AG4(2022)]|uniref:YopX family protein n=1 Tax=Bacillus sp. AG4(2022) TaxID=2962594 RepID=UPI002881B9FA|nr:YopX family protein [Bacillus sp. AG4(2022)]MDT0160313.1 YopX family protein [Bacillus sp. AG4(2022)]
MRNLKFRAFVDTYSHWHMTTDMAINADGSFFHKGLNSKKYPEWKLMQFTGSFDVNGTEIYEGDIVRVFVPTDPEMPEYVSHVFDYYGAFTVECKGMDIYTDYFVLGWLEEYEFEVIGNIYENPEIEMPYNQWEAIIR